MTVTSEPIGCGIQISWDRQARRNAWDLDTMTAIAQAIEAAGPDEQLRCIVLRGAGDHFSAGDDLRAAREATRADWEATIAAFQRLTRAVVSSPLPVLCAIDGVCVGGALEFTASCDARICTARVRLFTPEVRVGFVLSNAGSVFLPHVVGETAARDLLLTGGERDATWASSTGFATAVVLSPKDLDEAVVSWVAGFERTSRLAVAETKRLLNMRWGDRLEAALAREQEASVALYGSPDAQAYLESFGAS
jgi:enoyl-CoA hydratase/carnithine racemase